MGPVRWIVPRPDLQYWKKAGNSAPISRTENRRHGAQVRSTVTFQRARQAGLTTQICREIIIIINMLYHHPAGLRGTVRGLAAAPGRDQWVCRPELGIAGPEGAEIRSERASQRTFRPE